MVPNGLGGSIEIEIDDIPAAEQPLAPLPPTVRAADERRQASIDAAAATLARREQRRHNAERRQDADQVHRAALLCWLAHGALLSREVDEQLLQCAVTPFVHRVRAVAYLFSLDVQVLPRVAASA